ncbi:hypothetical protein Pmar_PMAR012869, partial [Perkinsus marinus ATCC 50983]
MVVTNASVDPMRAPWEYVPGTDNQIAINLTQSQYDDMSGLFPLDYDSHTLYGVLKHTLGVYPLRYIEMSHGL